MMAKFKVGDKVRIVRDLYSHLVGREGVIVEDDGTSNAPYRVKIENGNLYWKFGNAIEIVEAKPSKNERISLLESQVAELQTKVEALQKPKYVFGIDLAKPSPNEQRKTVIERAKVFVKDTINEYQLSDSEISFVVDDKKRSVSVTLSHLFSRLALAKAIAKCAPDDVFNADIGKAIALGRALGLDVSELENAVKPTEVVVGMKAEIRGNIQPYVKTIISGDNGHFHSVGGIKRNKDRLLRITDDTEAQY